MRDAQPTAIFLKDYQVPEFLLKTTKLHFELQPGTTTVTSELTFYRNPDSADKSAALRLDGQDIELLSVHIDGQPLAGDDYVLDDEGLTIAEVPDEFVFSAVGNIKPEDNASLEGLYQSSGMYCTQCEAQGFRKITFYPDRPDVMSEFTTTVVADKSSFPILLSNGNLIDQGSADGGRHFATWHDPHKKPAYLFALVAGKLAFIEDNFVTQSGRNVQIKIFVEDKDLDKCDHAMDSLKRAMRWDEQVYGREYDLDIFMIVAVDDFNMGAMENKGLNIFNTSCVLAKPETTTDAGFQRVEAVVAHEYFHNWSGNRVTCRDWFQLSLKEGFTVFRDAEFSADMGSPVVKRVEDAKLLRTMQFSEDAGPMAHPVRPSSFIEISNFYTLTVYEKGAEVVRMIHTLLGPDNFRKGSDLYFQRHDGQAVTVEDFVAAMSDASGMDLGPFMSWYHQAGTPVLEVSDRYDEASQTYTLTFEQSCPSTPEADSRDKQPYVIPMSMGLLGNKGALELHSAEAGLQGATDAVLTLNQRQQTFTFTGVTERPVPSLLRNFSAPVRLRYPYSEQQLVRLMTSDDDGFNRWDAANTLATLAIQGVENNSDVSDCAAVNYLISAVKTLLADDSLDPAMVAHMLTLPSLGYLIEIAPRADVDAIANAREQVRRAIAVQCLAELGEKFNQIPETADYRADAQQIANRSLKNTCLSYLVLSGAANWSDTAANQFAQANNMTDQLAALTCLVHTDEVDEAVADQALDSFYQQWQHESLVVNQWLMVQATMPSDSALAKVKQLMAHECFSMKNPNKVRSLIGAFCNNNHQNYHAIDGSGYKLLETVVLELDSFNPQIAARMLSPLTKWQKFDEARQVLMKKSLTRIVNTEGLSKDVYEVASKSLS